MKVNLEHLQLMSPKIAEGEFLTTRELGGMLNIHEFSIGRIFKQAYAGRRAVRYYSDKMYDPVRVAEMISKTSQFTIHPQQLPELIKRVQAMRMLEDAGHGRSIRTWVYWARAEVGPRPVYIKSSVYYLRSDVIAWTKYLAALPNTGKRVAWSAKRWCAESGPNVEVTTTSGDGGGAVHFSLSEETV